MPNPDRDYLTLLLGQYWFAPPVALWRAVELRTLAREPMPRPVLDLGCGDGLIAQALLGEDPPLEVGFDPWLDQVRKAPATGAYRYMQQAAGSAMPYRTGSFGTVLSNSVLEHIPELTPVLAEAARVLRPGGRFIATVPSDAFRSLLAGYRARLATGDLKGAEAYAQEVDAWLEHYRYPSPEAWAEMLGKVGLHLARTVYYMPSLAMTVGDRANRRFGVWRTRGLPLYRWLASPRLRALGTDRWLRRRVMDGLSRAWRSIYALDVPEGELGGGLLVVAEKRRRTP